ncbi:hypothetical protein CBOM_05866 [Ceraceosorus bombacis]|uniref:Uncharacterized protein n=1 Tax=Ceraceosorus bombacis TaxID=401625 RepID=A0A0P1BQM2_9BASI|nr:hypothetical protein CBOM_05866 [Ceraceosorus bombacis]
MAPAPNTGTATAAPSAVGTITLVGGAKGEQSPETLAALNGGAARLAGMLPAFRPVDQLFFTLKHVLPAMILQYISQTAASSQPASGADEASQWTVKTVAAVYAATYILLGLNTTKFLAAFSHKWGYLDRDVERNGRKAETIGYSSLSATFIISSVARIAAGAYFYRSSIGAPSLSLSLPFKMSLYAIIFDFFYYAYHRLQHSSLIPGLRALHMAGEHRATDSHPTPGMVTLQSRPTSHLDPVRAVGLHLAAMSVFSYVPITFGFHEWFYVTCAMLYTELYCLSGARVHSEACTTALLVRWTGDRTLNPINPLPRLTQFDKNNEDTDQHYLAAVSDKKLKLANFGQQSRVWDDIFGTVTDRLECRELSINWSLSASDRVPHFMKST